MLGSVAFISAPYGFGPSSKAVAISSHLPTSIRRVFLGYGPALDMARRSGAFSSCFELDFNSHIECVAKQLAPYDILIFVNTTRFISALTTGDRPTILVETLAWLRDAPPPCSSLLNAYFAQRFFHHPFAPELESLDHFTAVGAILPASISMVSSFGRGLTPRPRSPLVHCGGLFSPAMIRGAEQDFVALLFDAVSALNHPIRAILPAYFHAQFQPQIKGDIALLDCSPLSVHEQILGSKFCLTTTGIEFTYESIALGVPTLFLPPFNASQYSQLEYHQRACIESVSFSVGAKLLPGGFSTLSESTTLLQEIGMSGDWSAQFAEVSHFLNRLLTKAGDQLLQDVQGTQQEEMDGIGTDGAQKISLHVARELGLAERLDELA